MSVEAQQSERSLFVIKAPVVSGLKYGEKAGFTRTAKVQDETSDKPTEDLDPPTPDATSSLLESGDDDANDELMDELEDLDESTEPEFDDPASPRKMTEWNLKPMTSIQLGLNPTRGKVPDDSSWQLTNRTASLAFSDKLFAWAAPDISYNPLFFEDVALERYGQTKGLYRQPIASSIHFLKSAALLPYTSLHDPIDSCDHPLGYCRPGDSVSCIKQKHFFGNPWGRR